MRGEGAPGGAVRRATVPVFSPHARLVAWVPASGDIQVTRTDRPDRRHLVRTREHAARIEAFVLGPDDRAAD